MNVELLINGFKIILTNRKQFVFVNKHSSNMVKITCGVPQRSILGPLLFIFFYLYKWPCKVSEKLKNKMFADDTNLFITGPSMTQLGKTLNEELDKVSDWLGANLLSLNISKTSYIIFGNKKNVDAHKCGCMLHAVRINPSQITTPVTWPAIVAHMLEILAQLI